MIKKLIIVLFCFALLPANEALSASIDELKSKIADKGGEIRDLEREIAELDKSIQKTTGEKQTLNTELKQIDVIKKKLEADIKVTGKKINLAELNITKLEADITDKNTRISGGQNAIGDSLKIINDIDSASLPERLLSSESFSVMWNQVSVLEDIQSKTIGHIKNLEAVKRGLEADKRDLEGERKKFVSLNSQLSDQKKIAEQNIKLKNQLIKDTNNKEVNYRKLLADTEARKRAVESELSQFESDLRIAIDPSSLPGIGLKILSWPLDNVRITQYFGLTEFSKTQAIYNGKGHNGIDLGVSIGTPLKASSKGVVVGTGDTDSVCYHASYGKWVMIDHNNGLATIYGHMSLVKVSSGQSVNAGEIIGYTGNTGYATGPHLHFTVAATQAVKIGQLKSKVKGCGTYTIPLGPFNGYLDPLSYL
ncbi:MAG: peptidoglycan DD-metalloendopeptidase family protein [bacterium]|nr:peptidoglycan DD-metalloendopeptidase family protein [bacterium]